ncbi:MAG: Gfo/Idh/MocA family oxidoreductase [Cyclobacteriaceae bacterium]
MQNIKTALLSFGMSGKVFHAPFIDLHPGFELLGSWERSTKNIQKDYPSTKSYISLEAILSDEQVELIIVNTPTYTHFEYAKRALESGKHVVVEKAFTTNTQEALELDALAKSKGLSLSVFQNRRWDSDFLTVKRVMESNQLGAIIEARIAFDRYQPALSPKSHKEEANPGAGVLKDLGPHVIDQALTLFGIPKQVYADIGITREHSVVDDYFDILLKYDKLRVHVHSGYFFAHTLPGFCLFGTKGTFMKSRADVQEDQLKAGIAPIDSLYGIESTSDQGTLTIDHKDGIKVPTEKGNYMHFYNGVHESITNGVTSPVTASDGIQVMRIIDAALLSSQEDRVIRL